MADLYALTAQPTAMMLPSLAVLSHEVEVAAPTPAGVARAASADAAALIVDGTTDLALAKTLCGVIAAIDAKLPVCLVLTEGGLPAVTAAWGIADVILQTAGPAEVDARLRLLRPHAPAPEPTADVIRVGHLAIDEQTYTARYRDRVLDLTYKEFELLRYLAANPDHVFTREKLLSEVWGYDYYGGTRTVDVHIRRLRAKLGDHESVIGTVRNVGYRLLREAPAETEANPPGATAAS